MNEKKQIKVSEIIRLIREEGYTRKEVAKTLGLSASDMAALKRSGVLKGVFPSKRNAEFVFDVPNPEESTSTVNVESPYKSTSDIYNADTENDK
mgnify:CR=1 FL=1